jgi:hypothetical protein
VCVARRRSEMTRDELIGKVAREIPHVSTTIKTLANLGCPSDAGMKDRYPGIPCPYENKKCPLCWATAIVNLVESCREEAKP